MDCGLAVAVLVMAVWYVFVPGVWQSATSGREAVEIVLVELVSVGVSGRELTLGRLLRPLFSWGVEELVLHDGTGRGLSGARLYRPGYPGPGTNDRAIQGESDGLPGSLCWLYGASQTTTAGIVVLIERR